VGKPLAVFSEPFNPHPHPFPPSMKRNIRSRTVNVYYGVPDWILFRDLNRTSIRMKGREENLGIRTMAGGVPGAKVPPLPSSAWLPGLNRSLTLESTRLNLVSLGAPLRTLNETIIYCVIKLLKSVSQIYPVWLSRVVYALMRCLFWDNFLISFWISKTTYIKKT
jgi:hypothetical protein